MLDRLVTAHHQHFRTDFAIGAALFHPDVLFGRGGQILFDRRDALLGVGFGRDGRRLSRPCDKLAAVGLVGPRQSGQLGAFLTEYVAKRTDVKASTLIVWGNAQRNLLEFFGAAKPLRDITPGDADDWRLFLLGQGLAENTVNKRCSVAKQVFRAAIRRKLIPDNPFADLVSVVGANRDRLYFVMLDEAKKVLAACPDYEWRLLFALARFGGLRTPSESLSLRWSDVDWEQGRVTVPSPKTEHRPGGAWRVMPLFPELQPYLEDAFERAEDGAVFVIARYRNPRVNLRSQLMKIVRRAGLKAWPRLWHNLRASRETELAETFPAHVVCEWIGNSQRVAAKHYLQVTDEHFRRAAVQPTKLAGSALQKALQSTAAASRGLPQPEGSGKPENDETPALDRGLRRGAVVSETPSKSQGGPDWTRTNDLLHVKQAL